jgi:outer membrane protein assembly factor BamB
MGAFRRKFVITCVVVAFLAVSALAKRVSPKPVTPVISAGIRYSAEGDGRDQYVVAADASTGKVLWRVKVFHTHIKFWVEEDVQWVFITNLKISDNSLFVRDEKSRCYSVDLTRKHVKKQQCGSIFSQ